MAWINQFDFIMISVEQEELISYKTIVNPFDIPTWFFLAGSIPLAVVLLIVINAVTEETNYMQKGKSKEKPCQYGNSFESFFSMHELSCMATRSHVSAITFPFAALVQDSVSVKWLRLRRGKYAESIAMISWLIATTFLTLCYLSVLLSSLTKKEYEKPVDFIQDVLENDYKFLVPGGTRILEALKKDPRPKIKTAMQKRLVTFPYHGVHPPWVIDM